LLRKQALHEQSFARDTIPSDSIRALVADSVRGWLGRAGLVEPVGAQLDAMGVLYVLAHQDTLAHAAFAARLGEIPNVRIDERAFTLFTAADAFASQQSSAHFAAAERYVQALQSLGDAAAFWTHLAHATVAMHAYYAGELTLAMAQGMAALEQLPRMPFGTR